MAVSLDAAIRVCDASAMREKTIPILRPGQLPDPAWFNLNPCDPPLAIRQFETEGFRAYDRDCPPFPFQVPFDWMCDPFTDRNWKMQLHAWRMLDPYLLDLGDDALTATATGRDNFTKSVAIVDDWIDSTIRRKQDNDFTWYDLAVGNRALKLAQIALAAPALGVKWPLSALRKKTIRRHVEELSDPAKFSFGNHGFFQLHGLMALAWVFPTIAGVEACHAYAETQLTALLKEQFNDSGVHRENSPWYHLFTTDAVAKILGSPWWRGHVPPEAEGLLARAEIAKSWMVTPDRCCVPVGDSAGSDIAGDLDHVLDRPHMTAHRHIGARLDGYGIVRSLPGAAMKASSYLLLQAGFFSRWHKHSDCLSFVWWEAGEYVLIDSGRYGYQAGPWRDYFLSTRAHNAVEIDGKDYVRAPRAAYGSALSDLSARGAVWSLSAQRLHEGMHVDHQRDLHYLPGRGLVVIDRLKNLNGKVHDYSLWWHLNADYQVAGQMRGDGCEVTLTKGRRLAVTCTATVSDAARAPVAVRGETEPQRQGWWSPAYLQVEPATALAFPFQTVDDMTVVTLFEIVADGAMPQMTIIRRDDGFDITGLGRKPIRIDHGPAVVPPAVG